MRCSNAKADLEASLSKLLTFDYYDGPEGGLLRTHSGKWARFSLVVESPLRAFRVLEVVRIAGDWLQDVDELKALGTGMWGSPLFKRVKEEVYGAPAEAHYLAICDMGWEGLAISPVTSALLRSLDPLGAKAAYGTSLSVMRANGFVSLDAI